MRYEAALLFVFALLLLTSMVLLVADFFYPPSKHRTLHTTPDNPDLLQILDD